MGFYLGIDDLKISKVWRQYGCSRAMHSLFVSSIPRLLGCWEIRGGIHEVSQMHEGNIKNNTHDGSVCMPYMVTFTINIPPMLAYIYTIHTDLSWDRILSREAMFDDTSTGIECLCNFYRNITNTCFLEMKRADYDDILVPFPHHKKVKGSEFFRDPTHQMGVSINGVTPKSSI